MNTHCIKEMTVEEMINVNGGGVSEGVTKLLNYVGKLIHRHQDPHNKEAWDMCHKM